MKTISSFFLFCLLFVNIQAGVNIPLNNSQISYDGVWFARTSAERVIFNRHTESVLNNPESGISANTKPYALTQTGIRIRFRTSSPSIQLSFSERTPGGKLGLKNGFAVYANGRQIAVYDTLEFKVSSPLKDSSVIYEILLPSIHAVDFTGLKLDDGYSLDEILPLDKPVYAAIGNSIAHGTGQQSASYQSFPYILADRMNWDLHNLAVAGSRTGWPIAQLVKDQRVDYITIEFGFNDWCWDNAPLSEKKRVYSMLVDTLRYYQKDAKIFCITPLTTTHTESKMKSSFTIEDFRTMIKEVVKERNENGDDNLFVIKGDSISEPSMLKDGIHLNVEGAEKFALNLKTAIEGLLKEK